MKQLLVLFALILSFQVSAQKPLFEIIGNESSLCSTEEQDILTALQNDPRYDAVYPVVVNDLTEAVIDHKLLIELPSLQDTMEMPISFIDYFSETDYSVDGFRPPGPGPGPGPGDPCDDLHFNFNFSKSEYGLCGYIQYDDENYQLIKLCENQYYLLKDDPSEYLDCNDGTQSQSISSSESISVESRSSGSSCSLLILYTESADDDAHGSIHSRINHDIDQMNTILRNSERSDFEVNILAKRLIPDTLTLEQNGNARDELTTDSLVMALRAYYGADLVTVYLGNQYFNGISGTSSLASYNDPNSGYLSIVKASSSTLRRVFAHETFHNMGCQHQSGQNFSNDWARAITDSLSTVMAAGGQVDIDQLSNPDTGIGTINNDNARQIEEGMPNVAGFRTEVLTIFNSNINAPGTASNNESINFSFGTNDCPGSSNLVQLTYSTDGTNYISVPQNYIQGNWVVDFPMPSNRHLYIRVVMSCTHGGETVYDTKTVRVYNPDYDPCEKSTHEVSFRIVSEEIVNAIAYPNPMIGDDLTVDYTLLKNGNVKLSCYDLTGNKLYSQTSYKIAGDHSEQIKVQNNISGILLISIETDNSIQSKPVFKNE